MFYADSDEFLELPMHRQRIEVVIEDLLLRYPQRPPSAICYRWKWLVSDCTYERLPGLLLKRFRYSTAHKLFKSVVLLRDVLSMRRLHFPDLRQSNFMVDASLERIYGSEEPDNVWKFSDGPMVYTCGSIRHYWCKSFQEFAVKKHRGDSLNMTENLYSREFRSFFEWNGPEAANLYDPVDPVLLASVERELRDLSELPGVADLNRQISEDFPRLLEPFGGDAGLRQIYERSVGLYGTTIPILPAA